MASLFDGIFGSTNALPLAALFSQDSKFRASQFSQQVVASGGKYVQEEAVSTASPEAQPSSKAKKASKKRKHSTLPSAEPAEAVQITEPATDKISDSAVKAANRKKTAVSAAQKPAKASSAQQEVPNNAAKKSKHKKSKTMAEAMINAGQPEIDMPATTLLQKQKKAQKAKMNSSTGQSERTVSTEAAAETRALQSVQQTLPQAAADAQATMQRLSPEEQAERLRRTVFVGNLSAGMQRKALRKEFSQYGAIESVRKRSVPVKLDAKMSRRAAITTGNISKERGTSHAYIVFQQEDSAVAALASNMHVLDGLHLRVDRAGQSAHGSAGGNVVYERNRTVFVGNLPFDVEDEEIIVFFNTSCTKLGIPDPVQAVRVVRDSASQLGKGFGFVQFSSQQAARAALGCDGQLLRKRPLRVTKAMKVSANLKQLGQKKSGQRQERRPESSSSGGRPASDAGVKQVRPSNKAVAALQKKSEPAENWQGFKTKGLKKTTAGAAVKSVSAGQRPVAGKRKAPEKRASVAARKQKGKPGKG